MSSLTSWPTCHAVSTSHFDVEPKFEQPEYFHRTPGKGGWFCSACAPSRDAHLHSFNAMAAMNHENSQAHKDTVRRLTSWEPMEVDNWGEPLEPYQKLRYDLSREEDSLNTRVKRWIRDMARAEGIEVNEEEEEPAHNPWDAWDTGSPDNWGVAGDDWKRPTEQWGFPVNMAPTPEANEAVDPRAVADFKFVEKVAKARGLNKDRRRLHAFYRLPTEEKINRIQEIVHLISGH